VGEPPRPSSSRRPNGGLPRSWRTGCRTERSRTDCSSLSERSRGTYRARTASWASAPERNLRASSARRPRPATLTSPPREPGGHLPAAAVRSHPHGTGRDEEGRQRKAGRDRHAPRQSRGFPRVVLLRVRRDGCVRDRRGPRQHHGGGDRHDRVAASGAVSTNTVVLLALEEIDAATKHLGGGQITVRLHQDEDDRRRKFNGTENVRAIPASDPNLPRLYGRNDSKSLNRSLEDTLFLGRAHSRLATATGRDARLGPDGQRPQLWPGIERLRISKGPPDSR
jgi:hypothetical protein